jgi:hypothetical protein
MLSLLSLILLSFVSVLLSQDVADDTYILRVVSADGAALRMEADAESQIMGSIAEGSMVAAFEERVLGSGIRAYRVGETEGWVVGAGVEVVRVPGEGHQAATATEGAHSKSETAEASADITTTAAPVELELAEATTVAAAAPTATAVVGEKEKEVQTMSRAMSTLATAHLVIKNAFKVIVSLLDMTKALLSKIGLKF